MINSVCGIEIVKTHNKLAGEVYFTGKELKKFKELCVFRHNNPDLNNIYIYSNIFGEEVTFNEETYDLDRVYCSIRSRKKVK